MRFSSWNKWECRSGARWTTPIHETESESTNLYGNPCNVQGCNCNTPVAWMGKTSDIDEASDWFKIPKKPATPIPFRPEYRRFVKYAEMACKSLGWEFSAEQEEDDLLVILIDKCKYYVSRCGDKGEKHYVSAVVTIPSTHHEPDHEDEMVLKETNDAPECLLDILIDTHFKEVRRVWAMQATYDPQAEKEYEKSLEQA